MAVLQARIELTSAVILTNAKTQDYERRGAWLWVLTFVRMTPDLSSMRARNTAITLPREIEVIAR